MTKKLITRINKKIRPIKRENWRHARTSVEIAWKIEQKSDLKWLTSYDCNKNLDDEIKNQEKANSSPSYRCAATNN